MIKNFIFTLFLIAINPFTANAQNHNSECATKKANIQSQIDYARTNNHPEKIAGLETALRKVNKHCTDADQYARRLDKITDKEQKVNQRQAELEKAKISGDRKKIAKKAQKLDEAIRELKNARD